MHKWLKLHSERTQPYTIDDISVIIPSAENRYNNRWEWFWPQYVKKTHPKIVENTYVPCDPGEKELLSNMGCNTVVVMPRWIVDKTLGALEYITTRLTFRLANDIMVVREGWEEVLLKQFNEEKSLQIIAEIQHGTVYPEAVTRLQQDWDFIRREYAEPATAAVYPHGSRIFTQTATWNAYYRQVLRYTSHDHDELFFSQLARGDGVVFTHFGGGNSFLAHKGITNKDFSEEDITKIEADREALEQTDGNPGFRRIG